MARSTGAGRRRPAAGEPLIGAGLRREEVEIPSGGERLAAWLYRPEAGGGRAPGLVLMHGLTAIRDAQLDRYCERFAAAGLASLAFDFRHLGSSGGQPRQLVDLKRQYEDRDAALAYMRNLEGVDPARVAIWGTSFAGGHALEAAADHPWLAAAIAQTPMVDGAAPPPGGVPLKRRIWALAAGVRDRLRARRGAAPHYVPVLGPPGSLAVLTTPDIWESYTERYGLFERREAFEGVLWRNQVAARLLLRLPTHRPARRAHLVRCPLLVQVVEREWVVSNGAAVRAAERAASGSLRSYPGLRHFDIYGGEGFERLVADQVDFLRTHLKPER
jgi:dienelactone hydrolase